MKLLRFFVVELHFRKSNEKGLPDYLATLHLSSIGGQASASAVRGKAVKAGPGKMNRLSQELLLQIWEQAYEDVEHNDAYKRAKARQWLLDMLFQSRLTLSIG